MQVFSLWLAFAGYGFNPGSAVLLVAPSRTGRVAALAAANTSLSAAAGAISGLFTNLYLQERKTGEYSFDLTMAMNGALSGLVAITAPCGTVDYWAAIVIGIVSGWIYLGGSKLLIQLKLDDAVDAIPVHMFNGVWGLLATGLFSAPAAVLEGFGSDEYVGWFYELGRGSFNAILLANQVVAIVFILGWSWATMMPFFVWLNYMGWFRSDSLEELVGLDISYHGGAIHAEEDVKEEHVKAYKKKKGSRSRRSSANTVDSAEAFDDGASWTDMTMSGDKRGPERSPRDARSYASGASGNSMLSGEESELS